MKNELEMRVDPIRKEVRREEHVLCLECPLLFVPHDEYIPIFFQIIGATRRMNIHKEKKKKTNKRQEGEGPLDRREDHIE
jgi:hypothetical protein